MNQLRKCSKCGNTETFYINAIIVTDIIMVQEDDGKMGFVTAEDAESGFIRIKSGAFSSVSMEHFEKPLRCAHCDTIVAMDFKDLNAEFRDEHHELINNMESADKSYVKFKLGLRSFIISLAIMLLLAAIFQIPLFLWGVLILFAGTFIFAWITANKRRVHEFYRNEYNSRWNNWLRIKTKTNRR